MAILNTFDNKPVLSGIDDVSEFRIKNSSLAYNILSSGLYANKIRAIIRELSCNALDAQVMAGNGSRPFLVHLPTYLEPFFSIRDYGISLDSDEVKNVFTVYFESLKNNSNDYVGALGLGCKSPLSYTTNFTVICIKNGIKRTYTVYVNDVGVPAIALLSSVDCDEESGVEISLAVNNNVDIRRFREEAEYVYSYFSVKPIVTGVEHFSVTSRGYVQRDIIPGVHQQSGYHVTTVAVMGNIPYPVSVPNTETVLGDLNTLLDCGLEIHFDIGELEFSASREGLSYVNKTIDAIKNKLQSISDNLYTVLEKEVSGIDNYWKQIEFLLNRGNNKLWKSAVSEYIKRNDLPLSYRYNDWVATPIQLSIKDLAEKFNINLRRFYKSGRKQVTICEVSSGTTGTITVPLFANSRFVLNDDKSGLTRTKTYFRNDSGFEKNVPFYFISAVDSSKPILLDEFYELIKNPPVENRYKVSSFPKIVRTSSNRNDYKNVSILAAPSYSYGNRWEPVGTLDDFSDTTTYYYIPLSGFKVEGSVYDSIDQLLSHLKCGVFGSSVTLYGVRKKDIKAVSELNNWVNVEDFIKNHLATIDESKLTDIIFQSITKPHTFRHEVSTYVPDSPYVKFKKSFNGPYTYINYNGLHAVYKTLTDGTLFDKIVSRVEKLIDEYQERYPLLEDIPFYTDKKKVVDYIKLIDSIKGE